MKSRKIDNTIFYILPHADDWQLFMNPESWKDIKFSQNKIIFIITTAGDAGMGEQFWRAREEGMKASVKYCFKPGTKLTISEEVKQFPAGKICCWSVNHVVCYFLRLPDGGVSGEGFKENNYDNLQKLENGMIHSLSSLDGYLTLNSWPGFITLLAQIIQGERGSKKEKLSIKFLDPDVQANPSDHADHRSTGRAILSIPDLPVCSFIKFRGYGNSCADMLTPEEIFWKAAIFAVYEKTVLDNTGYSTLSENEDLYKKWILSKPEFYLMADTKQSRLQES